MRTTWVWVVVGLAACVSEGSRPGAPALETGDGVSPFDTVDGITPDEDTGVPDAAAAEANDPEGPDGVGGDAGVDGVVSNPACPDGTVRECESAGSPPACQAWGCIAQECVLVPLDGGDCDDGDACTADDACHEGVCRSTAAVACTLFDSPCRTMTGQCLAASGCVFSDAPAGDPCDDGLGPVVGTCDRGWRIAPDACDGAGACLTPELPSGPRPVDGRWFTVIVDTDGEAERFESLATDLELSGGSVLPSHVYGTDASWNEEVADVAAGHSYCAAGDGAIELALGGRSYQGQVDPEARFMTFGRAAERALGVAVRTGGDASQVHGTYRLVVLERYGLNPRTLLTSQGTIEFVFGCIEDEFVLSSASAVRPMITGNAGLDSGCLAPEDDGSWSLPFRVTVDGDTAQVLWQGAIADGGDVILLSRRQLFDSYGLVMMVREQAPDAAQLAGPWSFVGLRNGVDRASDTESDVTFESGVIAIGPDTRSLSGSAMRDGEPEVVQGYWWTTDEHGGYHQRVSMGPTLVHHTGQIATGGGLIAAWVAVPPDEDPNSPQALGRIPREGSLWVAVRRASLIQTAAPGTGR